MSRSITDTLARSLFQRGIITPDEQVAFNSGEQLFDERTMKNLLEQHRGKSLFVAHVGVELYYGTLMDVIGKASDNRTYSIVLSQRQVVRIAEIDQMYRVILKRCPAILRPPQSPLRTVIDGESFQIEEEEYFIPGGRYLYLYDLSTLDVALAVDLLGALENGASAKVVAVRGGAEVKMLYDKLVRYKGKDIDIVPIVSDQVLAAFLRAYRETYVNPTESKVDG